MFVAGIDSEALQLLESKAGPIIFVLHLGYGFGAIAAPKLVNAFLHGSPLMNMTLKTNTSTSYMNDTIQGFVQDNDSRQFSNMVIARPYGIAGGLMALLCVTFTVLFLVNYCGKYYTHPTLDDENKTRLDTIFKLFSPGNCSDAKPIYGAMFIALLVMVIFHIDGVDTMFRQFLFSFAVETVDAGSPSQGLNLNLLYWVTFVLGRAVSMIVSLKVPIPYICGTVVTLSLGNSVILKVWGETNPLVILICTAAFGMLNAALIPAFLLFANYYIKMTGVAVGLVYVFAGSGMMVYISLTGHFFSLYGPGVYLSITLIGNTIIAVNYLFLQVVAYLHGKRT